MPDVEFEGVASYFLDNYLAYVENGKRKTYSKVDVKPPLGDDWSFAHEEIHSCWVKKSIELPEQLSGFRMTEYRCMRSALATTILSILKGVGKDAETALKTSVDRMHEIHGTWNRKISSNANGKWIRDTLKGYCNDLYKELEVIEELYATESQPFLKYLKSKSI